MGKPKKTIKAGAVSANIWENTIEKNNKSMTITSVSVQKSYKDREGMWQHTGNLGINDVPKAMLVLQKAYEDMALSKEESHANANQQQNQNSSENQVIEE